METCELVMLGSFILPTGYLIASDPCYEKGVWCMGELKKAYCGRWDALATYSYFSATKTRLRKLTIKSGSCSTRGRLVPTVEPFVVGVDSGYVGFFDGRHFQAGNDTLCQRWYDYCKRHIQPPYNAGIITCGVVASARYGDGEHRCISYRDDEQVIHMAELILSEDDRGWI